MKSKNLIGILIFRTVLGHRNIKGDWEPRTSDDWEQSDFVDREEDTVSKPLNPHVVHDYRTYNVEGSTGQLVKCKVIKYNEKAGLISLSTEDAQQTIPSNGLISFTLLVDCVKSANIVACGTRYGCCGSKLSVWQ